MASPDERVQPTAGDAMPLGSIIGHKHIVDLLRRGVALGRVPQSLLFAGPEGVGKRAVAIALAQALNCPRRRQARPGDATVSSDDACGTCPTCQRIARGQHSDVTLIELGDESSIKIEVLRDRLLDVAGYRPFEAERRVYIIDSADAMTDQAQDALLKTLEEPPPSAILILVTAFPDTLRPTIQSRCRRLRFAPLAEADLARVLTERLGVDPAKASGLAAASGGSVSQALAEDAGDLDDDRDAAMGVLIAARTGVVASRLKAATTLAKHESRRRDREALAMRLSIMASLLRDLGVLAAGAPAPLANQDLGPKLRQLAPAFTLRRAADAFAIVTQAEEDLVERNASPKLLADWIAVTI